MLILLSLIDYQSPISDITSDIDSRHMLLKCHVERLKKKKKYSLNIKRINILLTTLNYKHKVNVSCVTVEWHTVTFSGAALVLSPLTR